MKRILIVALPALLAFGIAACDRPNTGTDRSAQTAPGSSTTDKSSTNKTTPPSGMTPPSAPGSTPSTPPSGTGSK